MTIEVENVSKSFDGKKVLDGFSLEIAEDRCYLLTGPSGSGKTTLLRIILGLEKPDTGKVHLVGDYKYPYICAGTVFQDDRLCEAFSAVENVAMVNKKLSEDFAREQLERLLPSDVLDRPVRELSEEMRRRVCIVRACAVPSDMLIMDEPFTGLDDETRKKAIGYIMERKNESALVLTSSVTEGLDFCRRIPVGT